VSISSTGARDPTGWRAATIVSYLLPPVQACFTRPAQTIKNSKKIKAEKD
jgi:hypothetical protein